MNYQENKFTSGEADNWFERNKDPMKDGSIIAKDWPLFIIEKYGLKPAKVLEIGCSNGYRLAEIKSRYDSYCLGIEPSKKAIEDGIKTWPDLEFREGILSELPINDDEKFDLTIVNYVLHWASRDLLLKSINEVDRTVLDGGYLIIGDFMPDFPSKNWYHHLSNDEVYTYKIDYKEIFLKTGIYRLVSSFTYEVSSKTSKADTNSDNRGVCSLLQKSLNNFYLDTSGKKSSTHQ